MSENLSFPREFESFLCCFCTEQSEVQKQRKKDENSRGKERFPTFLFSSKHMYIEGVQTVLFPKKIFQKCAKNISENVAERVKKFNFLSLGIKSITFYPQRQKVSLSIPLWRIYKVNNNSQREIKREMSFQSSFSSKTMIYAVRFDKRFKSK